MAGVVPTEGDWSHDCIKTVKSLLMEQYCSVKIADIVEEEVATFAVDVALPSSGKACLSLFKRSANCVI